MKKRFCGRKILGVIAAASILGLAGCGKKPEEAPIEAVVTPTPTEELEEIALVTPIPTMDPKTEQELEGLFEGIGETEPTEAVEEGADRYGRYSGKIVLDYDWLLADSYFSSDPSAYKGDEQISFWVSVMIEKGEDYDLLVIDPDLMDGYQQAVDLLAQISLKDVLNSGMDKDLIAKSAGYDSYNALLKEACKPYEDWWLQPIDETNPNPMQIWPKTYKVQILEDEIVDQWGQHLFTIEKDGSLTGVIESGVNRFSTDLEYNVEK